MAEEEHDLVEQLQEAIRRLFERVRLFEERLARLEQHAGDEPTTEPQDQPAKSAPKPAPAPTFPTPPPESPPPVQVATFEPLDAEVVEPVISADKAAAGPIRSTGDESRPSYPLTDAMRTFHSTQSTGDANALEQLVGGRLLTWTGAFVLIVSVTFFIPWAWEYLKLPDWVKVLGFHLLGIGILVSGHVAGRYRLPILAHALAGLGVFTLYATAFVTLHVYDVYQNLFGEHYRVVAFAECAIITIVAIAIALRTGSAAVIIIGALGGFLTPPVTSSGTGNYVGLFSYLAFLNVALIASAVLRKWSFLKPLSLIATAIMFGLWLMDGVHYNDSKAWPTEGFLLLHATIFLLGATLPPLVWKRRSNGWDLAALAANSLWFIGMTRAIFRHWEDQQLALVSWILCAMHSVLFGLTVARVTHADRMSRIHLALAGLFFVLAAPLQIDDPIYFGVAWILQGAVFTAIGLYFVDRQMLATALIVFGLALLRLFLFDYGSPARVIAGTAIDLRFFLIAASGVVTMIAGTMPWWMPRRQLADREESEDQAVGPDLRDEIELGSAVLLALGNLVVLSSLTCQWDGRLVLFLWTLDVAAIWAVGFWRKLVTVRWYAFGLAMTLLPIRTLIHLGDKVEPYTLLLNARFESMAVVAAVYFAAAWGYRLEKKVSGSFLEDDSADTHKRILTPPASASSEEPLETFIGLAGHAVLAIALSFEVSAWYGNAATTGVAPFSDMWMAKLATYSILWAVYAALVVMFGVWLRRKQYRVVGLAAFFPILLKVFFLDLAQLEQLPRVLATFVLGIMLLAVSFVYQRFAARVFDSDA